MKQEVEAPVVEVEISGRKAKIGGIAAEAAHPPWHPEDRISVYLRFERAVDSILGFYVDLPVKAYSRNEFFEVIKREGEKRLAKLLEQHRKEREEQEQRDERQKVLDSIAANIKSALGL